MFHVTCAGVITAENLLIENCVLKNTAGTPPAAGIDFEPNHPWERLVNWVMRDGVIEDNQSLQPKRTSLQE